MFDSKKFRKNVNSVLKDLGLMDKAKQNTMTDEEYSTFCATYKEKFGTELEDDLQESKKTEELEATLNQIHSIVSEVDEKPEENHDETTQTDENHSETTSAKKEEDLPTMIQNLVDTVKTQNKTINEMVNRATPDVAADHLEIKVNPQGLGTSATHLFGIEHEMFSLNKRWNKIAQNPNLAKISDPDKETGISFRTEMEKYAKSISQRYFQLQSENRLNAKNLDSGFGFTTTGLADAGLGNQFMVRRQDALIARILMLKSVDEFFPVRYGIQDREMITNAFFTEVSQGYQEGDVWKGGMILEPEFGYVDDAMFKSKFGNMKAIERLYIGYLNTQGSDPIKWSMIEYMLLNSYTVMLQEYNKRRIMGIYYTPEAGVPGSYLNAGTGVIYTLIRYMHENKLLPHSDAAFASYDDTTFLETVQAFLEEVRTSLAEDQTLDNFAIYLNYNQKQWWTKDIRAKYGKDIDFQGPNSYMNIVPDTSTPIMWIPNMGQSKFMFMQVPGNIQGLGYVPGEMLAVQGFQDMELIKAWSTWKEGTSAAYVGRRFSSAADLLANQWKLQQIFCNKPVVALADGATAPDASLNFWFKTGANSADTAITDIANAKNGPAYIIECGSLTKASTIAKAGKFATITDAYAPAAVGDYIMVVLNGAGTGFLELERQVNGVRTVNQLLQPNVPGGR